MVDQAVADFSEDQGAKNEHSGAMYVFCNGEILEKIPRIIRRFGLDTTLGTRSLTAVSLSRRDACGSKLAPVGKTRKEEVIQSSLKEYSDDYPFPSGLFFGLRNDKPLHVVAAMDEDTGWCYIITTYRPDLDNFEPDFKTRKK